MWKHCVPTNEQNEPSDPKRVYDSLRDKKFLFPSNVLLDKIKLEMEAHLKQNNEKNEKLIRLLEYDISSSASRRRHNSIVREFSKHGGSRISKNADARRGGDKDSAVEVDELEEMVLGAKKGIASMAGKDTAELRQQAEGLRKFRKYWAGAVERVDIDADESTEAQIVMEEGDLCCEQIELILPVFELYDKKTISFQQYKERVELIANSGEDKPHDTSLERESLPPHSHQLNLNADYQYFLSQEGNKVISSNKGSSSDIQESVHAPPQFKAANRSFAEESPQS